MSNPFQHGGVKKLSLRGKLIITLNEARDLVDKELIGTMSPYCKITLEGDKCDAPLESQVAHKGGRTPNWNGQSFVLNLNGGESVLSIEVLDKEFLHSKPVGVFKCELDELNFSGTPIWHKLVSVHGSGKEEGEVNFSLMFEGEGLPETHRHKSHGRHHA